MRNFTKDFSDRKSVNIGTVIEWMNAHGLLVGQNCQIVSRMETIPGTADGLKQAYSVVYVAENPIEG